MKLSELVIHTSQSLGLTKPTVTAVAGFLRGAGLVTSGGRGPGGAEMSSDDKVRLLLGTCCVGIASRTAFEVRSWTERCPGLIEHIEVCIKNPPVDTSVEFDVDGYYARFVRKDGKVKTFGKRSDAASYLTRTITAKAFRAWLDGLK
jgi:hypothetical protein